jgi:hypothetical protein
VAEAKPQKVTAITDIPRWFSQLPSVGIAKLIHKIAGRLRHAFVGHSYDRARDRVYHCLLLLGSNSRH